MPAKCVQSLDALTVPSLGTVPPLKLYILHIVSGMELKHKADKQCERDYDNTRDSSTTSLDVLLTVFQ